MALSIQESEVFTTEIDRWVRSEIAKMRVWVIGNPDRGKKKWGRFMSHWFIKAKDERPAASWRPYEGYITAAEEKEYYAAKRRSGPTGDFKAMGDVEL